MSQPNLAELKALAAALPPSERLNGSDTADVLSALVAYVTHGPSLVTASQDGNAGVLDFYHQAAVKQAQDAGNPEPERGFVTPTSPAAPAAAPQQAPIDYDKLAQAIVRAQAGEQASPPVASADESAATHTDVTEPAPDEGIL